MPRGKKAARGGYYQGGSRGGKRGPGPTLETTFLPFNGTDFPQRGHDGECQNNYPPVKLASPEIQLLTSNRRIHIARGSSQHGAPHFFLGHRSTIETYEGQLYQCWNSRINGA